MGKILSTMVRNIFLKFSSFATIGKILQTIDNNFFRISQLWVKSCQQWGKILFFKFSSFATLRKILVTIGKNPFFLISMYFNHGRNIANNGHLLFLKFSSFVTMGKILSTMGKHFCQMRGKETMGKSKKTKLNFLHFLYLFCYLSIIFLYFPCAYEFFIDHGKCT